MAQIKRNCSVTNGSQIVRVAGEDLTARVKRNFIFMVDGDLVPYTVASDSTYANGDTTITLTGAYQGETSTSAAGVFVVDFTYPDLVPTISQGDVGTAAVFTNAMYRLQDMIYTVSPAGLATYVQYYNDTLAAKSTVVGLASNVVTLEASARTARDDANAAKTLTLGYRDSASASSALAQSWATQTVSEVVTGQGYGAKKYAVDAASSSASAQKWATQTASEVIVGQGYGALKYANDASSAAATAQKWATQTASEVVTGQGYGAQKYANDAATALATAQKWATQTASEVVTGQGYGAKKYANDAASSATAADTSRTNAATSETNASGWANTAVDTVFSAGKYSALHHATKAAASATAAATAVTSAQDWATKTSAEVVAGQGYGAKKYSTDAATSASNALASENNALASKNSAQAWATQTASEVVTGQGYGAKKYAADAANSAAAAAQSAANASAGQVQTDWNAASGIAVILNKPTITSLTGVGAAGTFLRSNGTASVMSAIQASDVPVLNQNTTGNAATVTTNANLTGVVTSVGNATSIAAGAITATMLANTAVAAAAYGSATSIPTFTVDAKGRLTAAANVAIAPAWSSITSLPTTIAGFGITDAPTKTGSGASGTWGISITGAAATAASVTGTVAIANGGTGVTTLAALQALVATVSRGRIYYSQG